MRSYCMRVSVVLASAIAPMRAAISLLRRALMARYSSSKLWPALRVR